MDPVSAGLQLVTSLNTIINTLLNKASTEEIDKLLQSHINHRDRVLNFIDSLAEKTLHIKPPAAAGFVSSVQLTK